MKRIPNNTKFPTKAKKEILDWYRKTKDHKRCVDCGGSFRFWCLDYDHIPQRGKKHDDISAMVRKGCSKEQILKEMSLCLLRCKNCHANVTYQRRQGKKIVGEY